MANTIGKTAATGQATGGVFRVIRIYHLQTAWVAFKAFFGGNGFKFSRKPSDKELSSYQFPLAGSS